MEDNYEKGWWDSLQIICYFSVNVIVIIPSGALSEVGMCDMEPLITCWVQERVIYSPHPTHPRLWDVLAILLDVSAIGTVNLIQVISQWILVLLLYGWVSDTSE